MSVVPEPRPFSALGRRVFALPWSRILSRLMLVLALLTLSTLLLAAFAYLDVSNRYRDRITTRDAVESRPVAIVFGAGVYPSGNLSAVLADRMSIGIDLIETGKAEKLLLSGDNSIATYNEPLRMGDYALARGLPASTLAYDYAGRRTYDSCWRAKHIFGQERVILVTQSFHLPRALYTCTRLGVDAVGVPADLRPYRAARWFDTREALARIRAWFDLNLIHPPVVGGPPIDIFSPNYDGRIE